MNPDQWGHLPSRPVTLALTGSRNMVISYKTAFPELLNNRDRRSSRPLQGKVVQ